MKNIQNAYPNNRLTDLEYVKGDTINLPPNKVYDLVVDYPLNEPYIFQIKTGKKGVSYLNLLQQIYKAYVYVYKNETNFEIWGHDIEDLCLEGLRVNHKAKRITMDIGS